MIDKTCLTYWFPKIEAAGLPVPKTIIVGPTDVEFVRLFGGQRPKGLRAFLKTLQAAVDEIGYPCFLRTGQTSAKHDWEKSCYLLAGSDLLAHVLAIVNFSECVQIIGLDYRYWVVRELLPVTYACRLTAYGNMPLVREFRLFTKGGKVQCVHPYWPVDAVLRGSPDIRQWRRKLELHHRLAPDEETMLRTLAERAASACPDADWSIDFIQAGDWFLTDMAEAERSYHWPTCPNNPEQTEVKDRRQKRADRFARFMVRKTT